MSRYEFSFVVTEVELSEEQKHRVGRAVALAGAAELGDVLPPQAVTAPVATEDERYVRFWCGIPPVIELPGGFRPVTEAPVAEA
jgi:hypothetical protein